MHAGGRTAAVRMEAAQLRAGGVAAVLVALAWRPLLIGAGPLFPLAPRLAARRDWRRSRRRRRRAGRRRCWLRCCRSRCTGSRTAFTACRSTGCGGRRSARSWSASAACSSRACWARATAASRRLLDGDSLVRRVVLLLWSRRRLAGRAGLGHFGRRARAAADPRRLRWASLLGQCLPGADPASGRWSEWPAMMSGVDARADDWRPVRGRADRPSASALPQTIAAAAAAYAVSVLIMGRSILTEKIARRGRHILREYTVDALEFLLAGQLMTPDPNTLPATCRCRKSFASSPTRQTIAPIRWSMRRPAARAGVADGRLALAGVEEGGGATRRDIVRRLDPDSPIPRRLADRSRT